MEILLTIVALLFLLTLTAFISLRDEYKKVRKDYKLDTQHYKYTEHHLQTMIHLRDQRVSAQSKTIARLEADLSNCKFTLNKYEKNSHS